MINEPPPVWLPVVEAIKRIVWHSSPDSGAKERGAAEDAWRELCGHAFEKRIRAVIFTERKVALEADLAQFKTLQQRYLFNAGTQVYWLEGERRGVELEIEPCREFLDKHGHTVRGRLLFLESDLKALYEERPPEKPLLDASGGEACKEDKRPFPAALLPELESFVPDFARPAAEPLAISAPSPEKPSPGKASPLLAAVADAEIVELLKEARCTNNMNVGWLLVKDRWPGVMQKRFRALWRRKGFGASRGRRGQSEIRLG